MINQENDNIRLFSNKIKEFKSEFEAERESRK
jgi:hypothetical protein